MSDTYEMAMDNLKDMAERGEEEETGEQNKVAEPASLTRQSLDEGGIAVAVRIGAELEKAKKRIEELEKELAGANAEVGRRRADVETIVNAVNKYKGEPWATMRTTLGAAAERIALSVAEALQKRWEEGK